MNKYGLDTTEAIFCMAIAMLYPFFFNKLANKMTGYDSSDPIPYCEYPLKYTLQASHADQSEQINQEYEKCKADRDNLVGKKELNKHIILIVVALIGIVLASVIQTRSTKLGVGLGGIFTLFFALLIYWHRYNETAKLTISGLSLLLVTFLSVRLYRIDNIADIFALEFGTK